MKKIQLLLLLLVFISAAASAQSGKQSKALKPTNFQKRVTTIMSEKSRSYYSLSAEKASLVSLVGPGKLRVITRGRFAPEQNKNLKYEILYVIDGGEEESIKFSGVEPSKNGSYKNSELGVPAQMEDFEILLDRGNHSIEFKLKVDDVKVAARYIFTPSKAKKQEWIAYSPLQPSEPVDLISRESSVSYYRFSMDQHLKVEINGPTQLRILTRIENHYHMKGNIHYRVQVQENGGVINTYQLNSRRSEIAVYKEDKDLIPGKAREFVIDVPKGKHVYEIYPMDKDKSTVLGRILLPRKDVDLLD